MPLTYVLVKENALHHDDLDDMDGLADIENRLPSRNEVAQIIGTSKVEQLIGEDMPVFINPRGVEDPKGGLDVMAFGDIPICLRLWQFMHRHPNGETTCD